MQWAAVGTVLPQGCLTATHTKVLARQSHEGLDSTVAPPMLGVGCWLTLWHLLTG
jgi:hypothetical protein